MKTDGRIEAILDMTRQEAVLACKCSNCNVTLPVAQMLTSGKEYFCPSCFNISHSHPRPDGIDAHTPLHTYCGKCYKILSSDEQCHRGIYADSPHDQHVYCVACTEVNATVRCRRCSRAAVPLQKISQGAKDTFVCEDCIQLEYPPQETNTPKIPVPCPVCGKFWNGWSVNDKGEPICDCLVPDNSKPSYNFGTVAEEKERSKRRYDTFSFPQGQYVYHVNGARFEAPTLEGLREMVAMHARRELL